MTMDLQNNLRIKANLDDYGILRQTKTESCGESMENPSEYGTSHTLLKSVEKLGEFYSEISNFMPSLKFALVCSRFCISMIIKISWITKICCNTKRLSNEIHVRYQDRLSSSFVFFFILEQRKRVSLFY